MRPGLLPSVLAVLALAALTLAFALPALPGNPGDEVSALNDQARAALERDDPSAAVPLLERALRLSPDEPVLRANLAYAFYRRGQQAHAARRDADALSDFARAVELEPDEPGYRVHRGQLLLRRYRLEEAERELRAVVEPERPRATSEDPTVAARHSAAVADAWMLLGDALALQDDLAEAVEAYREAESLGDARLAGMALNARERSARQMAVERDYRMERTPWFTIRGPATGAGPLYGPRLASVLDRARTEVAGQLGWAPDYRATVVLYPQEDFREVTGTHDWVGGLFDRKIRLPIVDVDRDAAQIESAFRHEYTHLVVADLNPGCPTWINEGLAQVLEYGRGRGMARLARALDERRLARDTAPALADLPDSFVSIASHEQVALLYVLSHAFVDQVVQRYGMAVALNWIESQLGLSPAEAFVKVTGRPLADEEAQFRESLRTWR